MSEQEPAADGTRARAGEPRRPASCAASRAAERASVFSDEIDMDFRTACRTAEAGLRYIDVRKVGGVFSHEIPRAGWPELAGIMADHNLRLGAVQSNFGKCPISGPQYDEHVRFFPILVEQAHFFGTDVIRVFPFWNEVKFDPEALPPEGASQPPAGAAGDRARFRPAADLAAGRGCAGIEPEHSTYSGSPQEVARIVEAVDNPTWAWPGTSTTAGTRPRWMRPTPCSGAGW